MEMEKFYYKIATSWITKTEELAIAIPYHRHQKVSLTGGAKIVDL